MHGDPERAFRLCGDPSNDDDGRTGSRVEEVVIVFWYDHNMGWWGYAGMGIGMVLFWALIVAGIVALVIFVSGDRRTRPAVAVSGADTGRTVRAS